MNRFAGKFSIFYGDNHKLIFFDSRVGLVHNSKTTFKMQETGKDEAIPPEASLFLAYEKMDGWVVLQAYNGELLAFGGETLDEIIPTTTPSGNPRYRVPVYTAYFNLGLIRAARADPSSKTRLEFKRPDATQKGVTNLLSRYVNPPDYDTLKTPGLTNLTSSPAKTPTVFTLVQHADGVLDMTSGTKTVDHADFRQVNDTVRVDLSGEDLTGVNFGYSNFKGAILKGTKFTNGKFAKAHFPQANLDGADFTGADLDTVDFADASSWKGTILAPLKVKSCDFTNCDLREVVASAPLVIDREASVPTRFSHAKMKYSLLGPAWTKLHLDFLVMEGLPESITGLNAEGSVLIGMDLTGLNAPAANFDNATLHAVGFTGAKLLTAHFDGARLEDVSSGGEALAAADFTSADLRGAHFINANVSHVSFTWALLQQAKFTAATVRGAEFISAYMKQVDFSAVEQKLLHGVKFTNAFLVGCNFQGTDFSVEASLTKAFLQGADFTNAQLGGTNLADACIATESGTVTVTLPGGNPFEVTYEPTKIEPAVCTSGTTRCPNGDLGPCTGVKLLPRTPCPTNWPRVSRETPEE